jgi:hypothetical protein
MDEKKKIKIKIKKKPDEVASKQEVGEEINKSETPLPSVPEPTLHKQPQQTEPVSQERREVREFRRERHYEKRFDKYREERRYKPSYHKGSKEKGESTPFNREDGTKSQREQGATTQYRDRFRKKEGGQQGQGGFRIGDRFAKPAPKPSGGPKPPRAVPITPPKKTSIKESFKEPEIVEGEEEFVSKLDAAFIRKKKEEHSLYLVK